MLIVMKFGGSSLATSEKIENAAMLIAEQHKAGSEVVVVVSAQGDTTDRLEQKAFDLSERPQERERDVLLSCGEQISMALMAIKLCSLGIPAVSLTGWQAGIKTDTRHLAAQITDITPKTVRQVLEKGAVAVIAGFQGVSPQGDITTIGRGGSDTTAVALAGALKADLCRIYTDVSGVYSADPRIVGSAVLHDSISYDEMLEMANLGAGVLHNRSVELAKQSGVKIEVLSSFERKPGTIVANSVGERKVSGITCDDSVAMVHIEGASGGKATCILLNLLADSAVPIDVLIRSGDASGKISFSIDRSNTFEIENMFKQHGQALSGMHYTIEDNMSKVSVIGAGRGENCIVLARMMSALSLQGIEPDYITTGRMRSSAIIDKSLSKKAVCAIHAEFFG